MARYDIANLPPRHGVINRRPVWEGNDGNDIEKLRLVRLHPGHLPGALGARAARGAEAAGYAALRATLPKSVLDAGELVAVNSGSFPPYDIIGDDQALTGASADLETAVSELLRIRLRNETVSGLAGVLGGIKSGRYQLDMGPDGDFPDREPANDFIDWVREYVVFAVPKGNPKHINDIADTCGLRVAVQSGGSA